MSPFIAVSRQSRSMSGLLSVEGDAAGGVVGPAALGIGIDVIAAPVGRRLDGDDHVGLGLQPVLGAVVLADEDRALGAAGDDGPHAALAGGDERDAGADREAAHASAFRMARAPTAKPRCSTLMFRMRGAGATTWSQVPSAFLR